MSKLITTVALVAAVVLAAPATALAADTDASLIGKIRFPVQGE